MSDSSPSPSRDDGNHAVLVEDGQFVEVALILQHYAPYSRVKSTKLWYRLSLFLVLYWDDSHTLFSTLKTFLA